jgi:hypothetical protein
MRPYDETCPRFKNNLILFHGKQFCYSFNTHMDWVNPDSHIIPNWIKSQIFIDFFCLIHMDQLDIVKGLLS